MWMGLLLSALTLYHADPCWDVVFGQGEGCGAISVTQPEGKVSDVP